MGAMASGLDDCDLNDSRPARLRCGRIDADLLRPLAKKLPYRVMVPTVL